MVGKGKEERHQRMSLKAENWFIPGMKKVSKKMDISPSNVYSTLYADFE